VKRIPRGGSYLRVADPSWDDPLDGRYSQTQGGRWNPADSFPVVYLGRDERVARANVHRLYEGLPYGPEDIDPDAGPELVATRVPDAEYVDVITDEGCESVGLPASYPDDEDGAPVAGERCQSIGQSAWDAGELGIACRSAAKRAPVDGEELAWFDRGDALPLVSRTRFGDWY
jgi:RES domain-containing protein